MASKKKRVQKDLASDPSQPANVESSNAPAPAGNRPKGKNVASSTGGGGGVAGEPPQQFFRRLIPDAYRGPGMESSVKRYFAEKEDQSDKFLWRDSPDDDGQPAVHDDGANRALVVRYTRHPNDPKTFWKLHSITVQSPVLNQVLGEVLNNYPCVKTNAHFWEFPSPFEPLVHRRVLLGQTIESLRRENSDESVLKAEHATLLYNVIHTDFGEPIKHFENMLSKGRIDFQHLWTLFRPNTWVYSTYLGEDMIGRLVSNGQYRTEGNSAAYFTLTFDTLVLRASGVGIIPHHKKIHYYQGAQSITDLSVMPLHFRADANILREKLIERGDKHLKLAGLKYKAYDGVATHFIVGSESITESKIDVHGRIVIDAEGWNISNPKAVINPGPLNSIYLLPNAESGAYFQTIDSLNWMTPGADGDSDAWSRSLSCREVSPPTSDKELGLNDEGKVLLIPVVRGYSLEDKTWLHFSVDAVHDVVSSENAFDRLHISENQKELIMSFTETQQDSTLLSHDIFGGKSRGKIILLSGPSGVGKTLTAECVAEELKAPLVKLSVSDLIEDPKALGDKLKDVLSNCKRWNAILLIQRADIFVEKRNAHDVNSIKLVNTFRTALEYHEGIVFLTTHCTSSFDPAFLSRVHISLKYPELNYNIRKKVWTDLLDKYNIAQRERRSCPPLKFSGSAATTDLMSSEAGEIHAALPGKQKGSKKGKNAGIEGGKSLVQQRNSSVEAEAFAAVNETHHKRTLSHSMTSSDIDEVSRLVLNGRQIDNVVRTSYLLARSRGESLSYKHIEDVMSMTKHQYEEEENLLRRYTN